jgi:DNA-binding GntR family transcriptional regulator
MFFNGFIFAHWRSKIHLAPNCIQYDSLRASPRDVCACGAGPARVGKGRAAMSKHLRLAAKLREMIVEGELAPGSKINEAELAGFFGASRTPLREALKVLAVEGLVEIVPNRGAWVASMAATDLEPAYEVLAALDGLAGELAAQRINPEEIGHIRDLQTRMEAAHARSDLHIYFLLNQQIHEAILEASRNPALIAAHRALSTRVLATRFRVNLSPQRWAEAVREHQVILGLLELRNGVQLGSVLRAHILKKLDALKAREGEYKLPSKTTVQSRENSNDA